MTIDKLLNPRYEVIADYPSNTLPIGTIMECPNYDNDFTKGYWIQSQKTYPHLFKRLNWWEKREESEMPKYLKHSFGGNTEYYEVVKWDMKIMCGFTNIKNRECCSILTWHPDFTYQPATEEEYLKYIN